MEFRRIFKHKKWLLIVPSFVWWFIWELTKDSIMESTRDWFARQDGIMVFLDWLLQHPGIIATVFVIGVFIWAYIDTNKESEIENNLRVQVSSCSILDYYPQPDGVIANFWGHHNIVEVNAVFRPKGDIKLKSIELHTGRHTFQAETIPVIVVDSDAEYSIPFSVPSKIIECQKTSKKNYLRVLFNDRDCRSSNFSFDMVYEIKDKRYLIR